MATKISLRYQTQFQFIRDRKLENSRNRNKKKALRRFGMIVRQQGRKNIKKGRLEQLRATSRTGSTLTGFAALMAIRSGDAKAQNTVSYSSEPNLRTILYGYYPQGNDVLIGPVGFQNSKRPTVPERIEAERPFMGPALTVKLHELQKSIEKFGLV